MCATALSMPADSRTSRCAHQCVTDMCRSSRAGAGTVAADPARKKQQRRSEWAAEFATQRAGLAYQAGLFRLVVGDQRADLVGEVDGALSTITDALVEMERVATLVTDQGVRSKKCTHEWTALSGWASRCARCGRVRRGWH